MQTKKVIQLIEKHVENRELAAAKRLFPHVISKARKDTDLRLQVGALLLRTGQEVKAFRLFTEHGQGTHDEELVLANAANFLGASRFAMRTLERIPEKIRMKRRVDAGQILGTNFKYLESMKYLENAGTPLNPAPVPGPLGAQALLLRCYCLLNLDLHDELQAICEFFSSGNFSPRQRAFALSLHASSFVKCNRPQEAKALLEKFKREFTETNQSWSLTIYHKVSGIYFAKLEDFFSANKHLNLAWKMSLMPGQQPDSRWKDILYWKGFIKFKSTGAFPEEWARMVTYPFASDQYLDDILKLTDVPEGYHLTARGFGKERRQIHLEDMTSDLPLQLGGMLAAAGSYGVPVFRVLDVLWPEEPLALKTHLKRLEQLVRRLRGKGIFIRWENNHLWLDKNAPVSISLKGLDKNTCSQQELFLTARTQFTRADVELYFEVSGSSAKRLCQKWIREGRIQLTGSGSAAAYRRK